MENKIYGVTLKGSFDPMRINTCICNPWKLSIDSINYQISQGDLFPVYPPLNHYKTQGIRRTKSTTKDFQRTHLEKSDIPLIRSRNSKLERSRRRKSGEQ
jgi:hypothetical protein